MDRVQFLVIRQLEILQQTDYHTKLEITKATHVHSKIEEAI